MKLQCTVTLTLISFFLFTSAPEAVRRVLPSIAQIMEIEVFPSFYSNYDFCWQ